MGYALKPRGPGRFDLVHITREFVAGRWLTLVEIVRADIAARSALSERESA